MSVRALTPTNTPASATDISTPTLRVGDLYYNTSTGLMAYNGSAWVAVSSVTLTNVDAGVFDGTSPYDGGDASTTATQTIIGGTP